MTSNTNTPTPKPLKKPPLRIIIIAVCVTAAIITGIVLGVVFSNNLRKANVDKINLGDSYERVVKILDDPMDSLDSKYYWFKGAKDAEEALEMELTGKPYTLITVDFAEKDDVKTVKSVEYEVVDGSRLVVEKQTLLGSHSQYAVTEVIDYNTLGVKLEYTNGGWIKTRFDGVKQIADTSSSGIKTFVARYDEEEYEFRLNVVEPEKIGGKDTVLISYVDGETTHYQTLKKNSALTMSSFYKEGYTSYVIDQDKQKVLDGVEIPNNVTYNIVWSANQYKVSFGEIVPPAEFEIAPVTVTYDAEYQLPVPTKEGYIFAGWMDANLRTLTYPDGRGRDVWTKASDTHLYSGGFIKDGFEVTTTKNISEAGTVNGAGTYNYGTTVTLTASTNSGYTWLGWYDGDTKISEGNSLTYTFTMGTENATYEARWTYYTVTTNANLDNAGTYTIKTDEKVTVGDSVTLSASPNSGYTWLGWYDGDTKISEGTSLSYTFTMGTENATYEARWTYYTVTTNANLDNAGTYTIKTDEKVTVGDSVTLSASPNSGYTWLGWYDGDTKISEGTSLSYTFTMGASNKTYTAKWMECPVTLTKNIAEAGTVSGVEKTIIGASTTITASTNSGYIWLGWYDGDTKVSEGDSLTYTFTMGASNKTYTAKWTYYTVTTNTNISGAGTYTTKNNTKTTVGYSVTLTASTNSGYTWLGWYDGDTKVSEGTSLSYTFTMGASNKTYTAKWMECPVTLTKNIAEAGTVSGVEKTIIGASTTITASTNSGYTWLGWYDGDTKVSEGTSLSYTFTMLADDKEYTAKFELCTDHNYQNCVCTKCKLENHTLHGNEYCIHGDYIYFGSYPQTKVTDTAIKNALGGYNSSTWTSYGYYIEGNVSNYMYYVDKEYNGEKYRGVYFTQYRPYYTTTSSSTSNTYQDDNGYTTSTVYWFKYEPIKWLILTENYNGTGNALVLADMAIDSQQWDYDGSYSNNYANSTIRAWLNDTFYNTAFTDLQKALIQTTTVDNSVESTGYSTNQYACSNTQDKIFLPSYKEVTTYTAMDSNAERCKQSTDYAKAQGCYAYNSSGSQYDGNCYWWLRSPTYYYSYIARSVRSGGGIGNDDIGVYTTRGVAPALVIALD